MNTYKIDYRWNGTTTHVKGVVNETRLAEIQSNPKHVIVSCDSYTPVIRYQTADGCSECMTNEYVAHYNCRCGSNRAHCTSDYCY